MNILVYQGAFQYDVVNCFAEELAQEFGELGHSTTLYDIRRQTNFEEFIKVLIEKNIELIISFNGIQAVEIETMKKLIDKLDIIMGIVLVDHPFEHWQRIQMEKGKNTFICMYDEGYLHIVEDYIDNEIPIAQLCHAGIKVDTSTNEKVYDVVMAGTIPELQETIPELEVMPEGILKDIGKELYNRAIQDYSVPLDILLDYIIKDKGINREIFKENTDFQEALAYIYLLVDVQIRNIMRHKVLQTMLEAGIKVDLFGNCKVEQFKQFSNFTYHGSIEYKQLLQEISNSKILVNDVKAFINGSHERILSTMINKTLVLSNKNTYCNNDYIDQESIVYYDVNNLETLVNQIKYYLGHEADRKKIVEAAYSITNQNHTWKNRACELESIYHSFIQLRGEHKINKKTIFEKISIIVPCYNVATLVPRCISSLLNQTIGLENLEIILVNDASTDTTLEVLLEYEKQYPNNIIVINLEENVRQGGARNIGMQYATAEYIGFVDADDWVEHNMYERLYIKSLAYDCDIVSCRYTRDTEEGILEANKGERDSFIIFDDVNRRKQALMIDFGGGVWSKLYKKSFIFDNEITFPEKLSYEDNYWSALERLYVKRFYLLEECLYHYCVNLNSTILTKNALHHLDRMPIEIMKIEFYKDKNVFDLYHDQIEANFLSMFYVNTLHILFTRFDVLPLETLLFLQRKTIELFPKYKENKLFTHSLLKTIEMEMDIHEWEYIRKAYNEI